MKKWMTLTIVAAVALAFTFATSPAKSQAEWYNGEPVGLSIVLN